MFHITVLLIALLFIGILYLVFRLCKRNIVNSIIFLCVVSGASYFIYKYFYPTYSWNQKLTVEVVTPEGVVKSSSVSRVTQTYVPQVLPQIGGEVDIEGEAVVVDLGEGRYLYAWFRNMEGLFVQLLYAVEESKPGHDRKKFAETGRSIRKNLAAGTGDASGPIELDPKRFPRLVKSWFPKLITFADINDPTSAKIVDPNNLSATFGEGYSLKRMTLEVVNEPVTAGRVKAVSTWMNTVTSYLFRNQRDPKKPETYLTIRHFMKRGK